MKRKAILFLCMLYTMIASAQFSGSGTGTASDPYAIYNAMQLDQVRNFCNDRNVYFKLMDDIDLTEWIADNNPSQGWSPIGNSSSPFRGYFDGGNHKISGLYINRESPNLGLFGYAFACTITNVNLEGDIKGTEYIGGLIGCIPESYNYAYGGSSILNCTFLGKIAGTSDNIGGICGYIGGTKSYGCGNIMSCSSYADIIGRNNVGGIVGNIKQGGIISSCSFYGTINGKRLVGGLVGGCGASSTIQSCQGFGDIYGCSKIGGICGNFDNSSSEKILITTSSFGGNIICEGDSVGGIVGVLSGDAVGTDTYCKPVISVENSYFRGTIKGRDYIGGIAGYNKGSKVNNCYSFANISCRKYLGGISGYNEEIRKKRNNSYIYCLASTNACVANNMSLSAMSNCRRIIANIENSDSKALANTKIFVNGELAEVEENDGVSTGAKSLMYAASYQGLGWDFTNEWSIIETQSQPYFKWQTAPPVIESGLMSKSTTISGKSIDGGTIYVQIGGKTYTTTATGNQWTVTTDPLHAGAEVNVYAESDGKVRSYSVLKTVGYDGEGTEENPYKIYTADDLAGINGDACYKLMNNIDVTEYINANSPTKGWAPAATSGTESISLDGDGHTINGLWADRTEDYTGLLGNIVGGTIKNLGIKIAEGKSVKGGNYTGVLAGSITNVNVENVSIIGNTYGLNYSGGVVGYSKNGTLKSVSCSGDVQAGIYGGGIVGYSRKGILTGLMFTGNIKSSENDAFTGGIAGYTNDLGKISQSTSSGSLTSSGNNSNAGGLVGYIGGNGILEDCYSSMNVSAEGTGSSAAGAIAVNKGVVTRCYAIGNVKSNSRSAGVIAKNDGAGATMSNCVAANNKIETTSSTGIVSRVLGGTVNDAPAPNKNNYALKTMATSVNGVPQTIYDDLINGYAKQQSDLYSKATYETLGWSFSDVWKIDEGKGYPYISYSFLVPTDGNGEIKTTDISQYDNIVYVEDGVTKKGNATTLSVKLNNTNDVTGFKFNLILPKGISVAMDEDNFYMIDLSTERTTARRTDYFDSEKQSDGSILVTCKSSRNYAFSGNEGEVATIVVKADSQIADDDYAITLRNVELTYTNGTTSKIDNVVSVLTVGDKKVCEAPVISFINGKIVCTSVTKGATCHHSYIVTGEGEDCNPDNTKITIKAFATMEGYQNSKTVTKTFDYILSGGTSADVNGDGIINIDDVSAVINVICGGN